MYRQENQKSTTVTQAQVGDYGDVSRRIPINRSGTSESLLKSAKGKKQ